MFSESYVNDNHNVFVELNVKFKNNIEHSLKEENDMLNIVELKARKFAIIGEIIKHKIILSSTQKELIPIFDEVFSDTITSVYLASCSLDKPAQIVLRRVLELGIALVYLWDLPCAFWGWKSHDKDLNYNDMIEYLTSDSYKTFIRNINPTFQGQDIFNSSEAHKLYRSLSNTTHGKISTFESNLPLRYSHNLEDWKFHLNLVERVESVITELWEKRFFEVLQELEKITPSLNIHKRGVGKSEY